MNLFLMAAAAALIIFCPFFFTADSHLKTEAALPSEMQWTFTLMTRVEIHSPATTTGSSVVSRTPRLIPG